MRFSIMIILRSPLMKTIVRSIFLIIIISFVWTCEKDLERQTIKTMDVLLKNTEEYSYDFNISGDEEGASITTQSTHYQTSKLKRDSDTNWSVVYLYKPESGYIGTDYVEIEFCTGGEGTNCEHIEIVQLHFIITE